jgi:hypothetical protein
LLKQVNDASRAIISAIQGTDAKIAELQKQRQKIGDAPVTRAEFLGYIENSLDAESMRISQTISRALNNVDRAFFALEKHTFMVPFLTGDRALPFEITEAAAYWYLRPAIMERMAEVTATMEFPDDSEAVPLQKRRAMLAEIDAEIEQLRAERNELASQLQKAGVVR